MLILLFRLAPYIGAGLVGAFLGFQMGKPIHYREGFNDGKVAATAAVNRQIQKTEGMISDETKRALDAARTAVDRLCDEPGSGDPSTCADR